MWKPFNKPCLIIKPHCLISSNDQHKTLATSLNSSKTKHLGEEDFHYVDFINKPPNPQKPHNRMHMHGVEQFNKSGFPFQVELLVKGSTFSVFHNHKNIE